MIRYIIKQTQIKKAEKKLRLRAESDIYINEFSNTLVDRG